MVTPLGTWQWADNDGAPPLGNLRSMLSYHRVIAYRANRDKIREHRGAHPIWSSSHQAKGTTSWIHRGQPLRQRVQPMRNLWDLRWHGENKEIAARSPDPQVSACPICHRFWSQAHVLCSCPGTTSARTEGSLDLTIAINQLPPGPMLELGRKFKSLLIIPNQPDLMARRWAGQWDHTAIEALRPEIANCTRKTNQGSFKPNWADYELHRGCVFARIHGYGARALPSCYRLSPHDPWRMLDWDPRLDEDHG